ncbi:MAG: hypothetical protein WC878_00675 [Candidatus Paceibacterota bacterium]|jgi:hypothetical protein
MCFAHSREEAVGAGWRDIKTIFPPTDGWHEHTVFVNEVGETTIALAYKKVVLKEE